MSEWTGMLEWDAKSGTWVRRLVFGWQRLLAMPAIEQAFLAKRRYWVRESTRWCDPPVTTYWAIDKDGDGDAFGPFATREEARAACERHAGTTVYDPIPRDYDARGSRPWQRD